MRTPSGIFANHKKGQEAFDCNGPFDEFAVLEVSEKGLAAIRA